MIGEINEFNYEDSVKDVLKDLQFIRNGFRNFRY